METMRALVKYQKGSGFMEVRDFPKPVPKDNEVLYKVMACAIDHGADTYVWKDIALEYIVPLIPGGESCGVIEAVGKDVVGFKPGDRVVSEVIVKSCGKCESCLSGDYLRCPEKEDLGKHHHGAMAQYIAVPSSRVHHIPDNVSYRAAVLAEMASVCMRNMVELAQLKSCEDVAIVGPGPIGLCSLQIAKAMGAKSLTLIAHSTTGPDRIRLARKYGAENVYYSDDPDFLNQVHAKFPMGFGIVVEGAGVQATPAICLDIARSGGTVCAIGVPFHPKVEIPWMYIPMRDLTIVGSYAHVWSTWEKTMAYMGKGLLDTEDMCTKTYVLEDWEEAFTAQLNPSLDAIKLVICPNGDI